MTHRVLLLTFTACFASSLALAGDRWTLDTSTSDARIVQRSKANPGSVNTVVARLTGRVKLDADDLGASFFDLSIYPVDGYWRHALSAGGDSPAGYVPGATDQILLRFKSTRVVKTANGELKATGALTLTRVERSVTATPTEAYAGPVYGDPFIYTHRREVTLLFPSLSVTRLSGSLTPAIHSTQASAISGSVVLGDEGFPELLDAISKTNWPPVEQNRDCYMPSTVGEDYSGVSCAGASVAVTRDDNCQMPASMREDDSSSPCTSAAGNQTTIVLDLKLLRAVPASSIGMLSGKATAENR